MHTQYIHDVVSVAAMPTETHQLTGGQTCYMRKLVVRDDKGMEFVIAIFSLKAPESLNVEVRP